MTEIIHEHEWTDWHAAQMPARDTVVRESRRCTTWMCDAVQIRPVPDRDGVLVISDLHLRDLAGEIAARVDTLLAQRQAVLDLCDLIELQHGGVPSTFVVEIRAAYGLPRTGGYPPMTKRPESLAAQLAHYLEVRQHTLSTSHLSGADQLVAEADYVRKEAQELYDSIVELCRWLPGGPDGTPATVRCYETALAHVRLELADSVLAPTALAGMLPGGVTVEACIAEKTEADRGRG